MEYMRIEGFLGGAISKLINKGIEQKVGYRPDISLQGLKLETDDSEDNIRLNASIIMSQDDFNKLLEEVTK